MEVRIGIVDSPRELELELDDSSNQDEIKAGIEHAIAENIALYWMTDRRGRAFGIPVARVAFVEVGPDRRERKVGFSA
ncbi:MAG: DUF3107 domain-containing protein [Ferrimicrobium sp.]